MPDQEQARRGIFEGRPGESLFTKPFIRYVFENELPALFQKVEGMHDHRLLSIVTALIIENRVDKLLSAFLPRYGRLLAAREYSFSMKINTLEALAFIPPLLTAVAHCLRKVRNEFAHHLDREDFSAIPKGVITQMRR